MARSPGVVASLRIMCLTSCGSMDGTSRHFHSKNVNNFWPNSSFEDPIERVELIDDPSPWERAEKEGWEGVIAKRRGSIYEHRRSKQWLKMKCELSHDFLVGGFTDPQGKRVGLGALLVGHFDDEDFVFAGRVGTGFDTKLLLDLRAQLDQLEIEKTPFTRAVGLPRLRVHWVQPKIAVKVGFIEWTGNGKLRHPRLLAVVDREDDHAS